MSVADWLTRKLRHIAIGMLAMIPGLVALADTGPDNSELTMSAAPSQVAVLVTDTDGHRVGWDEAVRGRGLKEIPHSYAHVDCIENDETQKTVDCVELLGIQHVGKGVYHIQVAGAVDGTFKVDVRAWATNGGEQRITGAPVTGHIKRAQLLHYRLLYDPAPGAMAAISLK